MAIYILTTVFVLSRTLKSVLILLFFKRAEPKIQQYPTISLIQPITQGATNIHANLVSRLEQEYPHNIQHIYICDSADRYHLKLCFSLQKKYHEQKIHIVKVKSAEGSLASKIEKIQAGLPHAQGDVIGFIDDDIEIHKDTFLKMVPYLEQPSVGGVFGLAYGASWKNVWSAMNSCFVNTYAFQTYIPITYFIDPFTITGHFYLIKKKNVTASKGFQSMHHRFDEDTEISIRLRSIGLRSLQTPIIYSVHNEFSSYTEYFRQLKRWFIFPKQTLSQNITLTQRAVPSLLHLDFFIPMSMFILLFSPWYSQTLLSVLIIYLFTVLSDLINHKLFYKVTLPAQHVLLLPVIVFLTPIYILYILTLSDTKIYWRGQHLLVKPKGQYKVLS